MNLRIGCDLVTAGFQLRVACSVGADARPAFVCTLRSIGLRTERPPFRRTENPRIRDLRGTTPRFDHVSRRMSKTKSRSVSTPAYGASMIQRSLYVEASSAPRTCCSPACPESKQSSPTGMLCAAPGFARCNNVLAGFLLKRRVSTSLARALMCCLFRVREPSFHRDALPSAWGRIRAVYFRDQRNSATSGEGAAKGVCALIAPCSGAGSRPDRSRPPLLSEGPKRSPSERAVEGCRWCRGAAPR